MGFWETDGRTTEATRHDSTCSFCWQNQSELKKHNKTKKKQNKKKKKRALQLSGKRAPNRGAKQAKIWTPESKHKPSVGACHFGVIRCTLGFSPIDIFKTPLLPRCLLIPIKHLLKINSWSTYNYWCLLWDCCIWKNSEMLIYHCTIWDNEYFTLFRKKSLSETAQGSTFSRWTCHENFGVPLQEWYFQNTTYIFHIHTPECQLSICMLHALQSIIYG